MKPSAERTEYAMFMPSSCAAASDDAIHARITKDVAGSNDALDAFGGAEVNEWTNHGVRDGNEPLGYQVERF